MTLNGQPFTRPAEAASVTDVLAAAGFALERVAVIRNGEIVPRSALAQTPAQDGDVLEVVAFVGGG